MNTLLLVYFIIMAMITGAFMWNSTDSFKSVWDFIFKFVTNFFLCSLLFPIFMIILGLADGLVLGLF